MLRLARTDLFRARWSDEIYDEGTWDVSAKRTDLRRVVLRTRELMNKADPDDRHVLASVIRCRAGVHRDV